MNISPFLDTGLWGLAGVLLFFSLIHLICRIYQERRLLFWRKDTITPMSVKESIDNLPEGLLFYYPGGMVKLVNTRMENICFMLTDKALNDAESFWNTVDTGSSFVELPDGSAVTFVRRELTLDGRLLYEVTASDVTEEVRLNKKLDNRKEEVASLNVRLKALSESIKYMSMEREALDMKVRIHDSMGQLLLMAKRVITGGKDVDVQTLKKDWLANIEMVEKGENDELWQKPFFMDMARFDALGIKLSIEGELPSEEHLKKVVASALNVHATNVLRHAKGKCAAVSVKTDKDMYILEFTNDGENPLEGAAEGGGLQNLRRMTEEMGGRMETVWKPKYILRLYLPKKNSKEE